MANQASVEEYMATMMRWLAPHMTLPPTETHELFQKLLGDMRCKYTFKSGKNKGNECGMMMCKKHSKKEDEEEKKRSRPRRPPISIPERDGPRPKRRKKSEANREAKSEADREAELFALEEADLQEAMDLSIAEALSELRDPLPSLAPTHLCDAVRCTRDADHKMSDGFYACDEHSFTCTNCAKRLIIYNRERDGMCFACSN